MSTYQKYTLAAVLGTLAASAYPLYMAAVILQEMLQNGTVRGENYPKYSIPYIPISLALIAGVLLMPLLLRRLRRLALPVGSGVAVGVFLLSEGLLETRVTVTSKVLTTLEGWQMYMCYVPPQAYETRTWTPVEVLIGEYSPLFKLHFYLIALVLILAVLNSVYGFAQCIRTGERRRVKALVLQSVSAAVFLGLCILACFTAFFRDGELTVSPLSAVLMSAFFILFGLTAGLYVGSFLLGRRKAISVAIPAMLSAAVAAAMYGGELILLSNHRYRLGTGWFFEPLGGIVLAPADLAVIFAAGVVCAAVLLPLHTAVNTSSLHKKEK